MDPKLLTNASVSQVRTQVRSAPLTKAVSIGFTEDTLDQIPQPQKQQSPSQALPLGFCLEVDDRFYDTDYQSRRKNDRSFSDKFYPTVKGTEIIGLFSSRDRQPQRPAYLSRPYLSSSYTLDPFRTGVEIRQPKQWSSGFFKISAGTPGHLIDEPVCFGVERNQTTADSIETQGSSILHSADKPSYFKEIDLFDPLALVGAPEQAYAYLQTLTYPIVTSDVNQLENYKFNGIIEPFPIRHVISFFSINAPFEPHGVLGDSGGGNYRRATNSTDSVSSIQVYDAARPNKTPYLDASDSISMSTDTGESVYLGVTIGYFDNNINTLLPFDDRQRPRDQRDYAKYDSELLSAVLRFSGSFETYVRPEEKSAAAGFVYDSPAGTDSIAYGGMLY